MMLAVLIGFVVVAMVLVFLHLHINRDLITFTMALVVILSASATGFWAYHDARVNSLRDAVAALLFGAIPAFVVVMVAVFTIAISIAISSWVRSLIEAQRDVTSFRGKLAVWFPGDLVRPLAGLAWKLSIPAFIFTIWRTHFLLGGCLLVVALLSLCGYALAYFHRLTVQQSLAVRPTLFRACQDAAPVAAADSSPDAPGAGQKERE